MKNLRYYIDAFSKLSVSNRDSKPAPHKAVLLIAIINHIQAGVIESNRIELTDDLELTFASNWRKFVGDSPIFNCNIAAPYFFMESEPFWHLVRTDIYEGKKYYSVKELRAFFKYAEIDVELYEILKDVNNAACLTVLLVTKYLSQLYDLSSPIKTNTLNVPLCSFDDVHIYEYGPRSIFVCGSTKQYKEQFKEINGLFKPKGINDEPGWIFSKRRMKDVRTVLVEMSTGGIKSISHSPVKDVKSSKGGWNDAYRLVARRLEEGWTYDMILEELAPLYQSDPIRYGTPSGLMVTKATLSTWAKRLGVDYKANLNKEKSNNWKQESVGYQWVKEMIYAGVEQEEIIARFNEKHLKNPREFSTSMGHPLTVSTFLRWRREILDN